LPGYSRGFVGLDIAQRCSQDRVIDAMLTRSRARQSNVGSGCDSAATAACGLTRDAIGALQQKKSFIHIAAMRFSDWSWKASRGGPTEEFTRRGFDLSRFHTARVRS
jgi:hypothetical protein